MKTCRIIPTAIGLVYGLFLFIAPHAFAEYSDPELKVFLFYSSAPVRISSSSSLMTVGDNSAFGNRRAVTIKPLKSKTFSIDGSITATDSLLFESESMIKVQKAGHPSNRGYNGLIEVVPADNGIYLINQIPVESYLEGVLNAEISTNWPIEVVKAQAVISRTFALYQKEKNETKLWHLTAGLSDQVYHGAEITDDKGLEAIRQTRGIVVTYNGALAQTFYHSNCGGITEDAGSLWNSSQPYLTVKTVPFGASDPRFYWETSLSDHEIGSIMKKLGYRGKKIFDLGISEYTPSGRVAKLQLNHGEQETFLANEFRKTAGYRRIQSLLFDVIRIPGGFYFKGKGNGHGVGLSQWSAKEMAEQGHLYHEILHFFYQGTQLNHYWE